MKTKQRRLGLHISPAVAVTILFLLITDRTGVCALTLLAAFFHECGHLLAARLMHIPLRQLRLDFLGARMEVSGRMLSYSEEWLLCAAGPLTSLGSAALAACFWQRLPQAQTFSCASLVLGILNLLPIRTFDGGRMLDATLSHLFGARTALFALRLCSFLFLFLLWSTAVYFLLRAEDGLSLLCFSMSLLFRFFDGETQDR